MASFRQEMFYWLHPYVKKGGKAFNFSWLNTALRNPQCILLVFFFIGSPWDFQLTQAFWAVKMEVIGFISHRKGVSCYILVFVKKKVTVLYGQKWNLFLK